jgi:hypothetical protein
MTWLRRLFNAMSREEMAGIRLAEPRWALSGRVNPSRFFSAQYLIVPERAFLFLGP